MRFYTQQHQHYCGIDLHARSMFVCIIDQAGNILVHRKLPCDAGELLKTLKPYREGLVIAVECLFCWYWIADFCEEQGIPFVLGHALYMKADARCQPSVVAFLEAFPGMTFWTRFPSLHGYYVKTITLHPRRRRTRRHHLPHHPQPVSSPARSNSE